MKRCLLSIPLLPLLSLFAPAAFAANEEGNALQEYIYTNAYPGATLEYFGVQRNVGIDVAMLLNEPSLVGFEITGVSVDIPVKEGCECEPWASAWLTTQLHVEGEFNSVDLMQVEGQIKNYGTDAEPSLRLDLTFPQPYVLTEDGVYVGYSVTVKKCNVPGSGWTSKYPIVTVADSDKPDSFFIHCTKGTSTLPQKYPEWTDVGSSLHQALAMQVIMRGETKENVAAIVPLQTLYAEPSSTGYVYASLVNYGTNPITSISYSYGFADSQDVSTGISHELVLNEPLQGKVGASETIDIPIEVPEGLGHHSITLNVDKVNGVENVLPRPSLLEVEVVPFLPVHSPLVEDYSGFWCGNCPEAYVNIMQLKDKYGEAFLPISYHVTDQIQSVPVDALPSDSYGLPKLYMENREEPLAIPDLEGRWLFKRRELAPAELSVEIEWTDETHSALRADATARFVYDAPESDYKLAYALVEDDMSNSKWLQANYFYDKDITGPYWDLFCGKSYRVGGIVYDDIVVDFPSPSGIEKSLPSDINAAMEYEHSSVLSLKDAVCRYEASDNYGDNIIIDPGKLRVVVMLIDGSTGNVCNAVSSGYSAEASVDPSGIETIPSEDFDGASVSEIEFYALDGRKLNSLPEKGVVMVVYRLSDGRVITQKRIF